MFLTAGLMSSFTLPKNKDKIIFGINNRIVIGFLLSLLAVLTEICLNQAGALIWHN